MSFRKGEEIALYNAYGQVTGHFIFVKQEGDKALVRYPNTTTQHWVLMAAVEGLADIAKQYEDAETNVGVENARITENSGEGGTSREPRSEI